MKEDMLTSLFVHKIVSEKALIQKKESQRGEEQHEVNDDRIFLFG